MVRSLKISLLRVPPLGFAVAMFLAPLTGMAMDVGENTESASTAVPRKSSSLPERGFLIEALHQARRNGDEAMMRSLEAQLPNPKLGVEAAGADFTLRASTTLTGPGDPSNPTPMTTAFGLDVDIRPGTNDGLETHQALTSDSRNTLYVAWEDDFFGANHYIQTYYSADGGETWTALGHVGDGTTDLSQPSIAVGEGAPGDVLVLAYVVDNGVDIPFVEVATKPLSGGGFTTHAVPYLSSWESYAKPVVWTDSHSFSFWYAYMTAESAFDSSVNNINVVFWRSLDGGASWGTAHNVPWGDLDSLEWIDPDGGFGTSMFRVFLATYNNTDNTIYSRSSDDFGISFNSTVVVSAVSPEPNHPVDPDIEAAVFEDNVMLVCTKQTTSDDDIAQIYSMDAGNTFGPFYTLEGYTSTDEFAAELTANERGNSWHVAYTGADWWVRYNHRPQDVSAFWDSTATVVNEVDWASAVFHKKGIASGWSTDRPTVTWTDYRGPGYESWSSSRFENPIFSDGFESGDTSAWSSGMP